MAMIIRSYRWGYILQPVKRARYRNLFSAISIGFMANFLFPARLGECVRAYIIGRREEISKTASFATIVVERLFDGFTILSIMALVPFFLTVPPGKEETMFTIWKAAGLVFAIYTVTLLFLFFFRHRRQAFMGLVEPVIRRLPSKMSAPLTKMIDSFGDGLDILNSWGHLLTVGGWSFLLWGFMGLGNWIMFKAFGIELPIFAAFFLLVVQAFGAMFPSPGFVGTYQYAHVLGLSLFGISQELSLSLAILLHGSIYIFYVLMGICFLWVEGLGIKELHREKGAQ